MDCLSPTKNNYLLDIAPGRYYLTNFSNIVNIIDFKFHENALHGVEFRARSNPDTNERGWQAVGGDVA